MGGRCGPSAVWPSVLACPGCRQLRVYEIVLREGTADDITEYVPVLQQQGHSLQRAAPVRDHSGRIGERSEKAADDAQARLALAAAGDLPPHLALEPRRAQPPGARQVPAVPAGDHRKPSHPGHRPEWLPGRVQDRGQAHSSRSRIC
jgi:hypothetical protein